MTMSKRKIVFKNLERILEDAGYQAWQIHLTRVHIAALLFMACSQIGAAKRIDPWRAYRCLQVLLARTLQGATFDPKHVHTLWAHARLAGEREREAGSKDDVRLCPCCGRELPEAIRHLTLTEDDLFPHFSPQSHTK